MSKTFSITKGGSGSSGLIVGTTAIASGSNTNILYNNSNVLGEYTITGTGTVVAMQTAPTFITSITAPLVIGGTTTTSPLTLKTSSGNSTTGSDFIVQTGNNGSVELMRFLNNTFLGIGESNPLRKIVARQDDAASPTSCCFYNANTTNLNGITFSWRGDTTGAGATTFVSFGAIRFNFIEHDNATKKSTITCENVTGEGWRIDPSVNVGIGFQGVAVSTVLDAKFVVNSVSSSKIVTIIKGAGSQSADLLELQNSSSTVLTGFSSAGIVNKYNSIATVSNGVPSEYATVDLTAQTAAITATTLYTPTATGMYRISIYLQVTTASSGTSILGGATGVVLTYNDGDGNVAQTDTAGLMSPAGTVVTTLNTNTTATNLNGTTVIYARTGVAIQYAVGYTSVGVTPMQYAVHIKLEAL